MSDKTLDYRSPRTTGKPKDDRSGIAGWVSLTCAAGTLFLWLAHDPIAAFLGLLPIWPGILAAVGGIIAYRRRDQFVSLAALAVQIGLICYAVHYYRHIRWD